MAHRPGAAGQAMEEVAQLAERGGVAGLPTGPRQPIPGADPRLVHFPEEHDLQLARIEWIGHSC